jgi:hypothetical protein
MPELPSINLTSESNETAIRPDTATGEDLKSDQPYGKEGLAARERKLRIKNANRPEFAVLWKMIRSDPQLFAAVKEVMEKYDEAQEAGEDPAQNYGDKHRDLTGLLVGIGLEDRSRNLLDMAIDQVIERESRYYWGEIAKGNNYLRELVVGAGVNGTIYQAAAFSENPDPERSSLVIDEALRVGGQFDMANDHVFEVNDRNRPYVSGEANLPGTSANIAPLGDDAPIQQSDLSYKAYVQNDDRALAIRLNMLLSGRVMVGVEMVSKRPNPDYVPGKSGAIRATLRNKQTGEEAFVTVDRDIMTTGLGDSKTGLDLSIQSNKDLVESSEEQFKAGEFPRYCTLDRALELLGDPKMHFPIEQVRGRVLVAGGKDSGAIVNYYLSGHGGRHRKSVAQLNNVEITWVGADFETKEDFQRTVRPRYQALGTEMPREYDPEYYSRITPLRPKLSSVTQLDDGSLIARLEDGTLEGCDYVIATAGYEDRTDDRLQDFMPGRRLEDKNEVLTYDLDILTTVGSKVIYKKGSNIESFEVIDIDNNARPRLVTYRVVQAGIPTVLSIPVVIKKLKELSRELLISKPIDYATLPDSDAVLFNEEVKGNIDGLDVALATKVTGYEIYKVGPVSGIKPTPEERSRSSAFDVIPENTAAIFFQGPKVEALARKIAAKDLKSPSGEYTLPMVPPSPEKTMVTGMDEKRFTSASTFDLNVPVKAATESFPANADWRDMIQFAMKTIMTGYRFPPEWPGIEFILQRIGADADAVRFSISTVPKLGSESGEFVEEVFADPTVQKYLYQLTKKTNSRTEKARVSIPLRNGEVPLGGAIDFRSL